MKILSNDYKSSLPDSKITSKGGPANFARLFTNHIVSHTKHKWVGLLIDDDYKNQPKLQKLFSSKSRVYYHLTVPKHTTELITRAQKKCKPEIVFKKPILQIANFINELKPDIIFLNGFSIYNWILLKAGKITNTPIVIQHAGIWTKEIDIYKNLYPAQARKMMKEMEKQSSTLTSFEIFLNSWSKKVYRKEIFNSKNIKTATIPLPIPDLKLKPTKNKKNDFKELKIGVVARWDKIKNYEAVLALAKEIKKRGLAWDVYSVISVPKTKINQKFKQDYKKLINIEPLKNHAEMSNFYQRMDLIIVPSNFDVSPHVVAESLLNGTPAVISPNVGWVDKYKLLGAKNWIIDFKNPSKVITRIKKIGNKKMPKKLATTIRKEADPKICLNKYLKIFKRFTKR